MLGVECRGDGHGGIDCHADGVSIFRLGQVSDSEGMVVGSEFELRRGGLTVDEELIVLRPAHLYLAFQIIAVVKIKSQQAHTF